jgi:hypothetical protein
MCPDKGIHPKGAGIRLVRQTQCPATHLRMCPDKGIHLKGVVSRQVMGANHPVRMTTTMRMPAVMMPGGVRLTLVTVVVAMAEVAVGPIILSLSTASRSIYKRFSTE